MTSTIKFYSLPKEFKDKNAIFDSNFETYLNRYNTFTISNFQYIKNQLRLSIKVSLNQDHAQPLFNQQEHIDYVRILNEGSLVEEIPYYYFVINQRWRGEETVELELEMDTLNTFKNQYTLSNKTLITREHKDRFYSETSTPRNIIQSTTNIDITYTHDIAFKNPSEFSTGIIFRAVSQDAEINVYIYDKYGNRVNSTGFQLTYLRYIYLTKVLGQWQLYIDIANIDDLSTDNPFINLSTIYAQGGFVAMQFYQQTAGDEIEVYQYALTNVFEGYVVLSQAVKEYRRIIDYVPEGFNPVLFKKSESLLLDGNNYNNWYLLYANKNAVPSTDADYVNPVECYLISDEEIKITTKDARTRILYATELPYDAYGGKRLTIRWDDKDSSGNNIRFNIPNAVSGSMTQNGVYKIECYRPQGSNIFSDVVVFTRNSSTRTYHNKSYISLTNVNYAHISTYGNAMISQNESPYYIGSGVSDTTYTFNTIKDVDFTNSVIIKCIALPYSPMEALVNTEVIDHMPDSFDAITNAQINGTYLKLESLINTSFDYVKLFDNNPYYAMWVDYGEEGYFTPAKSQSRNIFYESKLFSSEFYEPKFVYDSFTFSFRLEDIDTDVLFANNDYRLFAVRYVVSKNVISKFMFQFTQYILKRSIQDYDNILVVERNNEKALYNNAYINYIRTGYNFDIKNKNRTMLTAGVNLGASIIGGATQTALGGEFAPAQGVGTLTSAFTGLFNNIMNAKAMDDQINQKLLSASRTTTAVSGADDIDILEAYSSNKAKLCFYECSDIMKEELYNFFYYCGYATHRYGAIDSTSRLYFNFVQANIDYSYTNNIPSEILEDIKMKYGEGVIFMHYVDSDYDLSFQYENWETSLL